MEPEGSLPCSQNPANSEALCNISWQAGFYGEELLCPCPTPKLEGHPISAVRDCLFYLFPATLHIWRPSPLSSTQGRDMPWWQGPT